MGRKHTLFRKIIFLIIIGILNVLPGGCGSSSGKATIGKTAVAPVVLEIEVFDRDNSPDASVSAVNNYTTGLIQKVWGDPVGITVRYIPVPRAMEEEQLESMISSASAPDIVFTYSRYLYYKYAREGLLTDLTGRIGDAVNLKALVDKNSRDISYNGRYFGAAAYRPIVDRHNSYIRSDLLEKLNLKMPSTTDEWYSVMKIFKEKLPEYKTGEFFPFGLRATNYVDNHFGAQHLLWSFVTASDEELQTLPYLMLPGFRDGVGFLNKLYQEGLIDPEFDSYTEGKDFADNVEKGRIGFMTVDTQVIYDYSKGGYLDKLRENIPEASLEPVECFLNRDGKYLKSVYPNYGMFIMVPASSSGSEADAAVEYLDWQASDEGLRLLKWGEPGKNYDLIDGIPEIGPGQLKINKLERYNSDDYCLVWNGTYNLNKNLLLRQIGL
ncbi:MAG: extracellular solute-binding protein, partial [Clostridiales bacterium]|nr:extracellular solute-binding protein [Clostridiales bacterium]